MESLRDSAWVTKDLRLDSPVIEGKIKYQSFKNKNIATKRLLIIFNYTYRSALIREASSCTGRGKYRSSHPNTMQTVRDFGTFTPKKNVSSKCIPSEFREFCRKGALMDESQKGW